MQGRSESQQWAGVKKICHIGIYMMVYVCTYIDIYVFQPPTMIVSQLNTIHLWLKFNTSSHFKIRSARTFHFVIPYDPVIIPALSHFFRVIKSTIFYGNSPPMFDRSNSHGSSLAMAVTKELWASL